MDRLRSLPRSLGGTGVRACASSSPLNMRRAAALLDADGVGAFKLLVKASLAEAEARNGELKAASSHARGSA